MLLAQARIVGQGPLADLVFSFADGASGARKATVVLGGGGVGKTSLLAAIASTRPGYAVAPPRPRGGGRAPVVAAEWLLGEDDPARPHPLHVVTPNAPALEKDEVEALRRREQAHFDRRAVEGGFVFVAFPSGRYFSRAPVLLSAPERSIGRYDVRTAASFDDATRVDLARDTKTVLSYAAIGAALARGEEDQRARSLERAMSGAVEPLARLSGVTFRGADPVTLEPVFARGGERLGFDDLPTSARHLVAFAALTVRALYAAYPTKDPRAAEGTVLIDDVDLHHDAGTQRSLVPALREALPHVQWIVTTSSPTVTVACAANEVLALRRMPDSPDIELFEGDLALVH